MNRLFALLALALGLGRSASAASTEIFNEDAAVVAVVQKFFDALQQKDG